MAHSFLIALLFSSFSISIVGQDVADSAPNIFACRNLEYATSSRLTLMPEARDPAGSIVSRQEYFSLVGVAALDIFGVKNNDNPKYVKLIINENILLSSLRSLIESS